MIGVIMFGKRAEKAILGQAVTVKTEFSVKFRQVKLRWAHQLTLF